MITTPLNPIFNILIIAFLYVIVPITILYLAIRINGGAIHRHKEIQKSLGEAIILLKENNRMLTQLTAQKPLGGRQQPGNETP